MEELLNPPRERIGSFIKNNEKLMEYSLMSGVAS